MCAIDRATLSTVCEFWAPEVKPTGITELVANALVMKGENARELNFRKEPMRPEAAEAAPPAAPVEAAHV
jgi:[DsrC]-trisulfide reductase subunit K